jgi:predicted DNA binding CopG/RHH family protein
MIKEDNLQEFTRSQLDTLEKQFADLKGKTISIDRANQLRKIFDRIPDAFLNDLRKRKIPFLSGLALSRMIQKGMPVREQIEEKKLMVKKGDKVREINDFEWRTYSQMGYKLIGKDGDVMKEDRYAGARKVFETITAVKNKAEKTGMPYSILKKVYDRGMAAWKGGHRPGATQQQWALARVNSFVTKSSGTWGGADKDLAAKVRGSKK